ncbi:histidine kinase [Nostoc linckia]|nr:histidine kinase [Nostoc linckia]
MGRWGDAGTRRDELITNAQCPMPNAQCPMPNAQCPMPND